MCRRNGIEFADSISPFPLSSCEKMHRKAMRSIHLQRYKERNWWWRCDHIPKEDWSRLRDSLHRQVETTNVSDSSSPLLWSMNLKRAALHSKAEKIEIFASHWPKHPLSSLTVNSVSQIPRWIEKERRNMSDGVFVFFSQCDDEIFFICYVQEMNFFSDQIQSVPLLLHA